MRAEAFDVALVDIVMPEMDGLEVLRALRDEPSPPEVIIITGNGTIETAITAMKLGAFDYLAKPYRMAEIEVLVRRWAWRRRNSCARTSCCSRGSTRTDGLAEFRTRYAPSPRCCALTIEKSRAVTAGARPCTRCAWHRQVG